MDHAALRSLSTIEGPAIIFPYLREAASSLANRTTFARFVAEPFKAESAAEPAPLCPSRHGTYGGNPEKRKFIREIRDDWYEICEGRYMGHPDDLAQIRTPLPAIDDEDPPTKPLSEAGVSLSIDKVSLIQPGPVPLEGIPVVLIVSLNNSGAETTLDEWRLFATAPGRQETELTGWTLSNAWEVGPDVFHPDDDLRHKTFAQALATGGRVRGFLTGNLTGVSIEALDSRDTVYSVECVDGYGNRNRIDRAFGTFHRQEGNPVLPTQLPGMSRTSVGRKGEQLSASPTEQVAIDDLRVLFRSRGDPAWDSAYSLLGAIQEDLLGSTPLARMLDHEMEPSRRSRNDARMALEDPESASFDSTTAAYSDFFRSYMRTVRCFHLAAGDPNYRVKTHEPFWKCQKLHGEFQAESEKVLHRSKLGAVQLEVEEVGWFPRFIDDSSDALETDQG